MYFTYSTTVLLYPTDKQQYLKFMVITYSRVCINQVKFVSPARGQLNREMNISFAPENLVSRDGFGLPVPVQPANSTDSG